MSAFEFYQKKKKKLDFNVNGNKVKGPIASTPLPASTLFGGVTIDEPPVMNVFLGSPIVKSGDNYVKLSKKQHENGRSENAKKIKKKNILLPSSNAEGNPIEVPTENPSVLNSDNTQNTDDIFVVKKVTKKKRKKLPTSHKETESIIEKPKIENRLVFNDDSQNTDGVKKRNRRERKKKLLPQLHGEGQMDADQNLTEFGNNELNNSSSVIPAKKRKASEDDSFDCRARKAVKKEKAYDVGSVNKGRDMLEWILSPVSVEDFFENYWEKKPLHIARNDLKYFEGICSKQDLDEAFRKCPVNFIKNVTVTSYENGERTTESRPGRARPNAVWDMYNQGHSIRLLNPQTFIPNVGAIVSTLQEYFRNMVGVNSYLTPAGYQGFAPHYDDIEAFCLQLEGWKHWKVYPPLSESETLPRLSSRDFNQDEIGDPVLEVTLQPGDLLYFPRGWVHQARSDENHHSLHITVSTYQCNTWADYLKTALEMALEAATTSCVALREGIPLHFLDEMGVAGAVSCTDSRRDQIIQKATNLFNKVISYCPWDEAADQLGIEFIHSSFPPPHEEIDEKTMKKMVDRPTKASIRLVSANVCRVCWVEESHVCYYSTDNSIEPKGEELLGFEVTREEAEVIQRLRMDYPAYTKCRQLITEEFSEENLQDLFKSLAQRALITVKFSKAK